MITCGKEHTEIQGNIVEILNDFTNVIMAVRQILNDNFDPKDTDAMIALSGKLAYTDDKTEEAQITDELAEIFASSLKDKGNVIETLLEESSE